MVIDPENWKLEALFLDTSRFMVSICQGNPLPVLKPAIDSKGESDQKPRDAEGIFCASARGLKGMASWKGCIIVFTLAI